MDVERGWRGMIVRGFCGRTLVADDIDGARAGSGVRSRLSEGIGMLGTGWRGLDGPRGHWMGESGSVVWGSMAGNVLEGRTKQMRARAEKEKLNVVSALERQMQDCSNVDSTVSSADPHLSTDFAQRVTPGAPAAAAEVRRVTPEAVDALAHPIAAPRNPLQVQ